MTEKIVNGNGPTPKESDEIQDIINHLTISVHRLKRLASSQENSTLRTDLFSQAFAINAKLETLVQIKKDWSEY